MRGAVVGKLATTVRLSQLKCLTNRPWMHSWLQ
ncbi:MAG: hypothetical protein RL342_1059, partial [Pseudomonadota bacterium]